MNVMKGGDCMGNKNRPGGNNKKQAKMGIKDRRKAKQAKREAAQ